MKIIVLQEGLDNKNLLRAFKARNDEFYTRYEDIENEVIYYKRNFKNKIVYCNCDNPFKSNFFFYFLDNFNELGLKKLISSGLNSVKVEINRIDNNYFNKSKILKLLRELKKNLNKNNPEKRVSNKFINLTLSINDRGEKFSYSSEVSKESLRECDIVVTNPPFSLFRDFINLLFEFKKDFLIIGSNLASSLRNLFPKIREGKVKLGMTSPSIFINPEREEKRVRTYWYSTLDSSEEKPFINLEKKYSKKEYPEYKNFKAINVDSIKNIPKDYYGIQGVPINFIQKYNPKQFKLIGILAKNLVPDELKKNYSTDNKKLKISQGIISREGEDINLFTRILIKKRR